MIAAPACRMLVLAALVATPAIAAPYGPPNEPPVEAQVAITPGMTVNDVIAAENKYIRDEHRKLWRDVHRMEVIFQVLNAVDAGQTAYCRSRETCHEINPLIGRNASPTRVIVTKALFGVLHRGVLKYFEDRNQHAAARSFERTTIAIQGGVVALNMTVIF